MKKSPVSFYIYRFAAIQTISEVFTMKLSMWILNDFLKEYHPTPQIKSGKMELRGVRFFSDSVLNTGTNIYLGRAGDFIDSEDNKIICVHNQDILLLETEDLDDVFNRVMDCFDFYNMWSDSCIRKINEGCTLDDILELSRPIFRDSVEIADNSHIIMAKLQVPFPRSFPANEDEKKELKLAKYIAQHNSLPLLFIDETHRAAQIISHSRETYTSELKGIKATTTQRNLFCGGAIWGWIIQQNFNEPASPGKTQLLEELASLVEFWLAENSETDRIRDFSEVFREVFSKKGEIANLRSHLGSLSWKDSDRKILLILENEESDTSTLSNICYRLSMEQGCLTGIVDEKAVLLYNVEISKNSPAAQDFPERVKDILTQGHTRAGISYEFIELKEICDMRRLAEAALDYGVRKPGAINRCENYILPYLMNLVERNSTINFYHPAVTQLETYDFTHGTDFGKTLFTFLKEERNYAKTAADLYVHRNTVQYRVEKIIELTGLDLENYATRLHLLISFGMKNHTQFAPPAN